MRLKLKIRAVRSNCSITANYYYYFSAAIYLLLKFGSPVFAEFLHSKGYILRGKKFKLFSFGLEFEKMKMDKGFIHLISPNAYLTVSSPMLDSFINNFILGSFNKTKFFIGNADIGIEFEIQLIESLPDISFSENMKFKLISPMTLSTVVERNNKLSPYYLEYDDTDLPRILKKNLMEKFELVNGYKIEPDFFEIEFDQNYIQKRLAQNKRISKLITIAEGTPEQTQIRTINCPFSIRTNPELIRIGYECGFGEKNSMGFGMAEVVKSERE